MICDLILLIKIKHTVIVAKLSSLGCFYESFGILPFSLCVSD